MGIKVYNYFYLDIMKYKIVFTFLLLSAVTFAQSSSLMHDSQSSSFIAAGINVTLGGTFIITGTFQASPMERADQYITRMYNQTKSQMLMYKTEENTSAQMNSKIESYAKRNIKLKRISGEEITIDLEKFRLTGDYKYNPYLKNEDVIIFPRVDIDRNFISIEGAVNNPVKFQYVDGDKLSDALLFAQGISKVYNDVKYAEIVRLNYDGNKSDIKKVSVDADIVLQPGDRIRVLADETNKKDYRVLVLGEVRQPGYISISKDNTTIKEVMERVGWFRESADIDNAEFIRATDSYTYYKKDMLTNSFDQNKIANEKIEQPLYDNNMLEELLMLRMAYLKDEDSSYFKIDNDLRYTRSDVLIDFSKLNNDSSVSSKYVVRDGDVILIPKKKNNVYVFGQVIKAGYVDYIPGSGIDYYIEAAGGYGQLARSREEVCVIKGKTRSWKTIGKENIEIESGDYIWVPKKTPRTFEYYFDVYGKRIAEVASIVSTIVTIILLSRN